ncbi:hypothetical protein GW17_00000630 [Ensete ventricosum]|nr:hypothetical protein GW17_00000630 [Ensete ventricosum]
MTGSSSSSSERRSRISSATNRLIQQRRRRHPSAILCSLQQPRVLPVLPHGVVEGSGLQERRRSGGRRLCCRRLSNPGVQGEVELGSVSSEPKSRLVVGPGGRLGGVEGTEPDAGRLVRVSYLRGPFAPGALPHSSEPSPAPLLRSCRRSSMLSSCSRTREYMKPNVDATEEQKWTARVLEPPAEAAADDDSPGDDPNVMQNLGTSSCTKLSLPRICRPPPFCPPLDGKDGRDAPSSPATTCASVDTITDISCSTNDAVSFVPLALVDGTSTLSPPSSSQMTSPVDSLGRLATLCACKLRNWLRCRDRDAQKTTRYCKQRVERRWAARTAEIRDPIRGVRLLGIVATAKEAIASRLKE